MEKVALGVATGFIILRHRKYRRNLLFGLTAFAMFLVFGGVVVLGDKLMRNPIGFLVFWGFCFIVVITVLFLAVYDMLLIRREHKVRVDFLEQELAATAEAARILAEEETAKMAKEQENEGDSDSGKTASK